MSTRKIEWKPNDDYHMLQDFYNALFLIRQIIIHIDIILDDYSDQLTDEEKSYLHDCKSKIHAIYSKYEGQSTCDLYDKVHRQRMLYALKHNYQFPTEPIEEFEAISHDFETCFDLEQEIHDRIVLKIWQNYLSDPNNDNVIGDRFAYIVHSGHGFISIKGARGFRDNEYDKYISCSLHTDQMMDVFNKNIGLIFKVTPESFVTSCAYDCGTGTNTVSKSAVNNVKQCTDGKFIHAGNPYVNANTATTKILTPKEIERLCVQRSITNNGEILNSDNTKTISEIIIDKEFAEPIGIYLLSNGCDIQLELYVAAKQMEKEYNVPIIVKNKAVYRRKAGLTPYTESELALFEHQLSYYNDENNYGFIARNPQAAVQLLDSYFAEIVLPNGYDEEIREKICGVFAKMKEYANKLISNPDQKKKDDGVGLDDDQ